MRFTFSEKSWEGHVVLRHGLLLSSYSGRIKFCSNETCTQPNLVPTAAHTYHTCISCMLNELSRTYIWNHIK